MIISVDIWQRSFCPMISIDYSFNHPQFISPCDVLFISISHIPYPIPCINSIINFRVGFSNINQPLLGYPMAMETPIFINYQDYSLLRKKKISSLSMMSSQYESTTINPIVSTTIMSHYESHGSQFFRLVIPCLLLGC